MKKMRRRLWLCAAALACPIVGVAGPVDINSADAETISAELNGIGMSKAAAIVEYREKNGPFRTADDLILVKGIGERIVEMNRENILLGPSGGVSD